ncbi:MAG: S41 family peptidase [Bacteroidota bacterium]
MKTRILRLLCLWSALGLALAACTVGTSAQGSGQTGRGGGEPVEITGEFTITNDFAFKYYVENAVALVDMHGFVVRDQEWALPVDSQVLGFMKYDPAKKAGSYDLSLPALPRGEMNDVDNNGKQNQGVQIFAVSYWPNVAGGPFAEGDDPKFGWPSYLASVRTDTENHDEVTGGELVVWSPDAGQEFPSGFGQDGLLFTKDDPIATIQSGYSIVDLDQKPFAFEKMPKADLPLYEPADVAVKDYTNLSYTEAFDKMFAVVQKEYAFNGIEGKPPEWQALYAEIKPRVEQAERDKDPKAFYLALRDFTRAFNDGHVSLSGGQYSNADFTDATSAGYGFAIRELDDGRVLVIYVMDGGPAAQAGMQVGAEVTRFNGEPIKDAIGKATIYAPQSSEIARRYQQARYLLRAHAGDKATVAFVNPGGKQQQAELTAIPERDSFNRTSIYFGVDTQPLLPVESSILTEGNAQVGYVRINSNLDDLNLIVRLFQRALQQFQARKVAGLIIDMRYNSGGSPLGLAGFLTDQEIPLGQLEYYSEKTGRFEAEGRRDKVLPNQEQYRFDKMVLLVGPACYSACEIEAYGFSQVPGMVVAGQYPTAGVEADVARGQFALPEGFALQVPTGRLTLPDGSIFLEGKGVQPTLKVPVDETTALATEDVVLKAGMEAVLQPLGAGITPSGPPRLLAPEDASAALASRSPFLEDAAREKYEASQFAAPGATTYMVPLNQSETIIWAYAWCAKDLPTVEQNLSSIKLKFVLDGQPVGLDKMSTYDTESNGRQCRLLYAALDEWPAGEHHLTTTATFTSTVNDGTQDFQAGDYVLEYTVYVKP